jgi:hypothetical protein
MNKDGLVVGEIGDLFPTNEEIRNVYNNGFTVNSENGGFDYKLSNMQEEKVFLWAIGWAKENVIKKATLKLYPNGGKGHI